ncbi:unnamed protein product [Ambrosiozyma monospora]|uniref:Unnamed protein product n=1 Tax=Ambrosiozyma monospora TaxID=43982 RepID=A0ACB5SZI3_AMBMO|nr:unnamed protein product [Ambrosiozyma monospora]
MVENPTPNNLVFIKHCQTVYAHDIDDTPPDYIGLVTSIEINYISDIDGFLKHFTRLNVLKVRYFYLEDKDVGLLIKTLKMLMTNKSMRKVEGQLTLKLPVSLPVRSTREDNSRLITALFNVISEHKKELLEVREDLYYDHVTNFEYVSNIPGLNSLVFSSHGKKCLLLRIKDLLAPKKLKITNTSLDEAFFNSMPDTIESMEIQMIEENIDYAIKLPTHKKNLKIFYSKDKTTIKTKFEIVKSFLSHLSCSRVKLFLDLQRFSGETFKISFGNLAHLKILKMFTPERFISFDSTDFPPLEQLGISAYSISDQLPHTLKCLDLDFCMDSIDNPVEFWQIFISPLNSLTELTLQFDMQDADLSGF